MAAGARCALFVESCRKVGVLPGLYVSTHRNAYWNVRGHYVAGRRGSPGQETFNRVAEKMTEELCSRCGSLVQIWYDAGVTPEGLVPPSDIVNLKALGDEVRRRCGTPLAETSGAGLLC